MLSQHKEHLFLPLPVLEGFVKGCGLRRAELERVRVRDISRDADGRFWVYVMASEEAYARNVPVFAEFSWALEEAIWDRSPEELLFPELPVDLDVEPLRYIYARCLYYGTLESLDIISYPSTFYEIAQMVKRAMGWQYLDPHLRLWMRHAERDFLRGAREAWRGSCH